jgi:hypothetical protein
MAKWIKENTPKDSVFISDPETQNIIGSLSNRETIRGPYPNLNEEEAMYKGFSANSSKESKRIFCEISKSNNTYIIVSGRISKWIARDKREPTWKVWMPQDFEKFSSFDNFFSESYFENVHNEENQIYVFKVKC